MNPGDSCCSEVALCETPRPRRFVGAILGRLYQTATIRAAIKLVLTINGSTRQDPP